MKRLQAVKWVVVLIAGAVIPVSEYYRHRQLADVKAAITGPAETSKVKTPEPPVPASPPKYDEEILGIAAMQRVSILIPEAYKLKTSAEINKAREDLKCIEDWAQSQPDRQVKSAYLGWVQYYTQRYNDREKELKSGDDALSEKDKYWNEIRRQHNAARALDIPKPKKCQTEPSSSTGPTL